MIVTMAVVYPSCQPLFHLPSHPSVPPVGLCRPQVQFKAVCDGLRQGLPRFILQGDEIQLDRGAMGGTKDG